ncbi:hypothetical protein KEM60_01594 [Austwickia sp. TVS 96-490-7B]|uniref:TetR/AcrR family transcriptional regulator n=1 Tax=Austwickia sp. TVS 96-490-7B TaxID=2830843 RepID=UPI001C55F5D2|nr:TetR/AcrR family transcriptional regulator [Austwickia sp. TVS 96-490-7B]MBW3085394.1 hypothetical protein [Austwickia sp. TVS 96-490-7B]
MPTTTHERIRDSAGRLFHELGYTGVTIRGVADDAGVSPALVMKLFGSKAALYATCAPQVGQPSTENVPFEELGVYLVNRIVARIRTGEQDPWAQGVFLTWQSPDPDVERRLFADQVLSHVRAHLPDTDEARLRADIVGCHLVGLSLGLRTLNLRGDVDTAAQEQFIDRYSALIQAVLDGRDPGN